MTPTRYAFYGRVSTEDEQDPTLSFPRQLANAKRRVDGTGVIVAHYYDIESGKLRYDQRGGGHTDRFDIGIPRDGGLQELLVDAARPGRTFDRVIVESMSRIARRSAVAFRIEEELSALGVRLCCADEPLEESFGTIVLRHVNIGIARGYHHELMIKSRQGYETAATQGWHNGGVALYGYRFVEHPHPNPHKARGGTVKRTLELDPVRASVVRHIYDLYLGGGRGLREIRDLLNADLGRYPPPTPPDPTRALGKWSSSSVWEVLRNPKYTGYQVWNRRARKTTGKINPPSAWVWSDTPSHPAIITVDEHRAAQARAASNVRVRQAPSATKTEYLFRGLLRCGACGLRMWGARPRSRYYFCQVTHQRATIPADHPPSVYLGEPPLIRAVTTFLAAHVFGPDRYDYWRAALQAARQPVGETSAGARIAELEAEINDLERRLSRQIQSIEDEESTPAMRRRIAARVSELEASITQRRELLSPLHAAADRHVDEHDLKGALEAVPSLGARLDELPQRELRGLLDTMQFGAVYQPNASLLQVSLALASPDVGRPVPLSANVSL